MSQFNRFENDVSHEGNQDASQSDAINFQDYLPKQDTVENQNALFNDNQESQSFPQNHHGSFNFDNHMQNLQDNALGHSPRHSGELTTGDHLEDGPAESQDLTKEMLNTSIRQDQLQEAADRGRSGGRFVAVADDRVGSGRRESRNQGESAEQFRGIGVRGATLKETLNANVKMVQEQNRSLVKNQAVMRLREA